MSVGAVVQGNSDIWNEEEQKCDEVESSAVLNASKFIEFD